MILKTVQKSFTFRFKSKARQVCCSFLDHYNKFNLYDKDPNMEPTRTLSVLVPGFFLQTGPCPLALSFHG